MNPDAEKNEKTAKLNENVMSGLKEKTIAFILKHTSYILLLDLFLTIGGAFSAWHSGWSLSSILLLMAGIIVGILYGIALFHHPVVNTTYALYAMNADEFWRLRREKKKGKHPSVIKKIMK
ncbi:MAG: hypothetical protein A2W22_05460 [Candidatus Levybacteria bacterium RBG_16_35_11]|nr:MAG: hypothetical protein A2W22_05460 [Candidatus Levybacteria bacterium RBG_16_35_11]